MNVEEDNIKQHLMLDLETLSLASNAAILSVGVALFSLNGEVEALYHKRVKLDSCLKAGLHVDAETIEWWMKQPEENRNRLFALGEKDLDKVMYEIDELVHSVISGPRYIWSHGSNFDTVVYENASKAVNHRFKVWWSYKDVRDTRTLFDLANYKYTAKGGHDALDDAMNQAKAVCEAYKQLFKL